MVKEVTGGPKKDWEFNHQQDTAIAPTRTFLLSLPSQTIPQRQYCPLLPKPQTTLATLSSSQDRAGAPA